MTFFVVGTGFTGATVAERLATAGHEVRVFEKRARVGGSAEDYRDQAGRIIQKYGPHVFHTNSQKVWDYVQRFGAWRPVQYKVGARVGEQIYRLPLDFQAIEHDLELVDRLRFRYGFGARVGIVALGREFPEFAAWCIEHVFRGYNEKHWGLPFEEVPASVLARLPFVVGYQESYFTDKYQAVPEGGYTALIERMLDHRNIKLECGVSPQLWMRADHKIVWTGSPDAFFDEPGRLPYRSVTFFHGSPPAVQALMHGHDFATVTFPDPERLATRCTSLTRLMGEPGSASEPCVVDLAEAYVPGRNEPFYPIPLEENIRLAQEYDARRPPNVWFAGRLGSYQYLNMDQAIAQALALVERIR